MYFNMDQSILSGKQAAELAVDKSCAVTEPELEEAFT